MAGVLEFALGLESSNFMRELGVSSRELLSFAGIAEGAHYAIEKMGSAIERGAHLNDLSARTGETVGNLYQLEEAFKRAGLGAEAVGPSILRIRKALSGVNEMGGNTNSIFASLGLDREKLQSESPLDAIQQITGALHKLNINDATGAANGLFGRNGAGDMIQLANNAEDMAAAFEASKNEAAVFAKTAKAFKAIGDTLEAIKSHVEGLWAGLAAALTPELNAALEQMEAFTKNLGSGISGAIQFGGLHVLLADAITAAIEQGGNYGTRVFSALAAGFGSSLVTVITQIIPIIAKSIFNGLSTAINFMMAEMQLGLVRLMDKFYKSTGMGNSGVAKRNREVGEDVTRFEQALGKNQQDQNHESFKNLGVSVMQGAADGFAAVMNDWKDTAGGSREALDKFNSDLASFSNQFMAAYKAPKGSGNPGAALGEGKYKPQVTDLEKIGFVFGNGNSGDDSARRTADNTQKAVDQLINLNNTNLKLVGAVIGVNLVNN